MSMQHFCQKILEIWQSLLTLQPIMSVFWDTIYSVLSTKAHKIQHRITRRYWVYCGTCFTIELLSPSFGTFEVTVLQHYRNFIIIIIISSSSSSSSSRSVVIQSILDFQQHQQQYWCAGTSVKQNRSQFLQIPVFIGMYKYTTHMLKTDQ